MDANMFSIMTSEPKGLIANRADVLFNGAMGQKVLSEATVMSELFIACGAFVRFVSRVNPVMFLQIPLKKKEFQLKANIKRRASKANPCWEF